MGKTIFKILNKIYNFICKKSSLIITIYRELLDIIYPPEEKCIICKVDGFIGLCSNCKSKIKRANPEKNYLSYGFYGGILKKLILEFKYRENYTAGSILAQFLLEVINTEQLDADIICYVPMTNKSTKKRGFNQCELIAEDISYYTNIPVSNCLKKIRDTKEQKTLSKEERAMNLKGAFIVNNTKYIKNKSIILIDDVMTTGATVEECKNILKKYGANKIIVLTIAKGNI